MFFRSGDALENVISERVNNVIKEDYLDDYKIDDKRSQRIIGCCLKLYNDDITHISNK